MGTSTVDECRDLVQAPSQDRWYAEHMSPVGRAEQIAWHFNKAFLSASAFASSAPDIEGIDPEWQERSRVRLIWLKLRDAIGASLSFSESKKLALSNRLSLYDDVRIGVEPTIGPHESLVPFLRAINQFSNMYSFDSARSELIENPENPNQCIIKPSGRVSFIVAYSPESEDKMSDLIQRLTSLANEYTETHDASTYQVRAMKSIYRVYIDISWMWDDIEKVRAYIHLRSRLKDPNIDDEERFKLENQIYTIAREARDSGTFEQHLEFIQKASDLIAGHNIGIHY